MQIFVSYFLGGMHYSIVSLLELIFVVRTENYSHRLYSIVNRNHTAFGGKVLQFILKKQGNKWQKYYEVSWYKNIVLM